jgi:hypothetical protein
LLGAAAKGVAPLGEAGVNAAGEDESEDELEDELEDEPEEDIVRVRNKMFWLYVCTTTSIINVTAL